MTVRVEPHAYPTIPGQATNEGGGGAIPVQYLNLDSMAVSIVARAGKNGNTSVFSNSQANNGLKWSVTGVEVIDITGLSVIEEFSTTEIKLSGPFGSTEAEVIVDPKSFAYSVGTNINRTVEKKGYDKITRDGEYAGSVNLVTSNIVYSGTTTFTIKVVNSMGAVLQTKEITVPISGVDMS